MPETTGIDDRRSRAPRAAGLRTGAAGGRRTALTTAVEHQRLAPAPGSRPVVVRRPRPRERAAALVHGWTDVPRVEWGYRAALLAMFGVAVLLRLPATGIDLPPFQFCDEQIFSAEVSRMLAAHTQVTTEFRSGAMNLYPVLWLAQATGVAPEDVYGLTRLGRWIYPVLLASAAVLPVASAARLIGGARRYGLVAAGVLLLSPMLLAVSRYWYPDHYIVFFAALIVRILAGAVLGPRTRAAGARHLVLLGLTWGLALSVKYTFLLAALPIGIVLLAVMMREPSTGRRLLRLVASGLAVGAVAVAVFLLVDPSVLIEPGGFRGGWQFNVDNYSRPGGGPDGIGYYAFFVAILAFGPLLVPLAVVGGVHMWRRSRWLTVALASFPLLNVVYLGLQGVVYGRNIVASLAFVIPFVALGVVAAVEWSRAHRRLRIAVPAGLAVFGGLQVAQIAVATVHDLQPDSQPAAAQWIATTLPKTVTPGTNAVCSVSPAHIAGLQIIDDPTMKQRLPYYVFTSYWDSPVMAPWRGRDGVLPAVVDQKYMQYYYANDRRLPVDFFTLPWPVARPDAAVPAGYRVVKRFSGNGPEVLILHREG